MRSAWDQENEWRERRDEREADERVQLRAQLAAMRAQRDDAEARCRVMRGALVEIAKGKPQYDNEHPMGEWFSMAGRFMTLAQAALTGGGG